MPELKAKAHEGNLKSEPVRFASMIELLRPPSSLQFGLSLVIIACFSFVSFVFNVP
jgi:hypothetical protein